MVSIVLNLAAAAARVAAPGGSGDAETTAYLYWAPWCAPCRTELKNYPVLAKAVAPIPLVVVALDTGLRERALLWQVPANRLSIEPAPSFEVLARLAPPAAGLPYAVIRRADGQTCATTKGVLTAPAITRMRRECEALPH